MLRRPVLPESLAIACIGCVDLVVTLALIAGGIAREGNPLMGWVLVHHGPIGLVAAKALLISLPIVLAEAAATRRVQFVRPALRATAALYTILLSIAYARLLVSGS
jgi:hypothetical protein